MKAELIGKISSYIFMALMAFTAVVLVMFYCVDYNNQSVVTGGSYATDPAYTDLLMYWIYALLFIGIVCVAVFGLMQFVAKMKADLRGALKSLGALAIMIALFAAAYAVASAEPILINGKVFEETATLLVTDVCLYVQYVLLAVSVVALVLSLLGVFKGVNKINVK